MKGKLFKKRKSETRKVERRGTIRNRVKAPEEKRGERVYKKKTSTRRRVRKSFKSPR